MKCYKCEKEIQDDFKICPYCGTTYSEDKKETIKIIQEYKSIDNLYSELEKGEAASIKGKMREKIIEK